MTKQLVMQDEKSRDASFPRSAWERTNWPLRGHRAVRRAQSTQSVEVLRSHAERGNEECPQPPAPSPQPRRGLTLIELLVVIIILTTVVAAAIPILSPAGADREIREATRGANTYITGAQTRAALNRRPFGVALKRLSQDTGRAEDRSIALEMYYVEQQPPYTGFSSDSRVCVGYLRQSSLTTWYVRFVAPGTTQLPSADRLPPGWDADLLPGFTIQVGDVIEIGKTRFALNGNVQIREPTGKTVYFPPNTGGQLVEFTITPINDTGQLVNTEYDEGGRLLRDGPYTSPAPTPQRYWSAPMPYKILRQPVATSDPPYQLPEGTAIDLRASGFGKERFFQKPSSTTNPNSDATSVDNNNPVFIMFAPEGRVERLSFNQNVLSPTNIAQTSRANFNEAVVDNVYLLVGKRENIPPVVATDATLNAAQWNALTTDEQRIEKKEPINWLLGQSRWIVIGSQSGRVVSIENASVDPAAVLSTYAALPAEQKRSQQILAAREFTYEMANVGGR